MTQTQLVLARKQKVLICVTGVQLIHLNMRMHVLEQLKQWWKAEGLGRHQHGPHSCGSWLSSPVFSPSAALLGPGWGIEHPPPHSWGSPTWTERPSPCFSLLHLWNEEVAAPPTQSSWKLWGHYKTVGQQQATKQVSISFLQKLSEILINLQWVTCHFC